MSRMFIFPLSTKAFFKRKELALEEQTLSFDNRTPFLQAKCTTKQTRSSKPCLSLEKWLRIHQVYQFFPQWHWQTWHGSSAIFTRRTASVTFVCFEVNPTGTYFKRKEFALKGAILSFQTGNILTRVANKNSDGFTFPESVWIQPIPQFEKSPAT